MFAMPVLGDAWNSGFGHASVSVTYISASELANVCPRTEGKPYETQQ